MAYVLQSFSSGAILTNSQLFQTEENIATHVHGLDGVAGTGVSIRRETKTQAFTIQPSDSGKLFECYDAPYVGTFQRAGVLGNDFSIMLKNQSTEAPVLLLAASGQTIDGRSGYLLCPRESLSVFSNSAALFTNGASDPVIVYDNTFASSTQEIELDLIQFANHFTFFELMTTGLQGWSDEGGVGQKRTQLRISTDSLQSYLGDGGYNNVGFGADTNFVDLQGTVGDSMTYSVRFNQGTDAASRTYPVFHVRVGVGYPVNYSDAENIASVVSPGVIHGVLIYSSGEYIKGYSGNGLILKAYGRK